LSAIGGGSLLVTTDVCVLSCCRLRDVLYLAKNVLHGAKKISLEEALKRVHEEKADLDPYVALTDDILYLIKHSPVGAEKLEKVKSDRGWVYVACPKLVIKPVEIYDIVPFIMQYSISGTGFN
jgi:uncharacterized protein YihD (DUF1040 family)